MAHEPDHWGVTRFRFREERGGRGLDTPVLRSSFMCGALFALATAVIAQSRGIAITHVTVVDPGGERRPGMTVVVRGHEITAVDRDGHSEIRPGAEVIDGSGKFVIPGLWDMHSHFRDADRDLKMDIANGVLGTRNMGGAAADVFPLRDAIGDGRRLGPRLVACGPILDGPNSWSNPQFTISVKTAGEARAAVASLKKQGSDCVKVYDGLSRDSYFAIIDEARRLGVPVVGHLPSAISVREASEAGQRSLEHGVALAGGSAKENEYIRRRLDQSAFQEALKTKNFALIPAKIARDESMMLDTFNQDLADATYRLLAKNRTFVTPTLVTQRSLTFIDELDKEPDPRAEYVSVEERQWWKPENGMLTKYRTPEYIAMRKREYAKTLEEVRRAQVLGVRLLAGTDITIPYTYPGFSLHDELKLFVEAGLSPMQALETATTNPALCLGLSRTWGRIAPGYTANLVLLNADPLIDISNTTKIDAVVLNGELLNRARLDQLLKDARAPAVTPSPTKR
ncbi:MAG TPA: amidohydrolase family protein [Thermoanaerobaculia bacterium]|nr:amidohydrolase family protein [Thermoanaerobaculia bacterium]